MPNQNYDLMVIKMVINKDLEENFPVAEDSLHTLQEKRDMVVWNLATKIHNQSGHTVELSFIRDLVNLRIKAIKDQLLRIKEQQQEVKKSQVSQPLIRSLAEQEQLLNNEINRLIYRGIEPQACQTSEQQKSVDKDSSHSKNHNEDIKEKIFIKIRDIVSDELNLDKNEVIIESHLYVDLLADSVDTFKIACLIEEEFEVEIPNDLLGCEKPLPSWPLWSSGTSSYDNVIACTIQELVDFVYKKIVNEEDKSQANTPRINDVCNDKTPEETNNLPGKQYPDDCIEGWFI